MPYIQAERKWIQPMVDHTDYTTPLSERARIWLMMVLRATVLSVAVMSLLTLAVPFTWGLSLFLIGPALGLCIGLAQQSYLRKTPSGYDPLRWLLWSIIGSFAAQLVIMVLRFYAAVSGIVPTSDGLLLDVFITIILTPAGIAFGSVQLLAVKFRTSDALLWVLGSLFGLVVGGVLGFEAAKWAWPMIPWKGAILLYIGDGIAALILGSVMTAIYMGITGALIMLLFRQHRSALTI
jgi:hypothetical protein